MKIHGINEWDNYWDNNWDITSGKLIVCYRKWQVIIDLSDLSIKNGGFL
jgi:hypothetical protein